MCFARLIFAPVPDAAPVILQRGDGLKMAGVYASRIPATVVQVIAGRITDHDPVRKDVCRLCATAQLETAVAAPRLVRLLALYGARP